MGGGERDAMGNYGNTLSWIVRIRPGYIHPALRYILRNRTLKGVWGWSGMSWVAAEMLWAGLTPGYIYPAQTAYGSIRSRLGCIRINSRKQYLVGTITRGTAHWSKTESERKKEITLARIHVHILIHTYSLPPPPSRYFIHAWKKYEQIVKWIDRLKWLTIYWIPTHWCNPHGQLKVRFWTFLVCYALLFRILKSICTKFFCFVF